jgi:hypothetical protein
VHLRCFDLDHHRRHQHLFQIFLDHIHHCQTLPDQYHLSFFNFENKYIVEIAIEHFVDQNGLSP